MSVNPAIITNQASRTNLVPAVLWAYGESQNAFTDDDFANEVWARQAATQLSQLVNQHGTIERALSALQTGNPEASTFANNPTKGFVDGVLGLAGSQATYGVSGFKPINTKDFTKHANDVHDVFDSMAALGGVVTSDKVAQFANFIQPHLERTPSPATKSPEPLKPVKDAGPNPKDVAEFTQHAMSLGIDPDHLTQYLPFVGLLMRKTMGKSPTLEDYAPMAQMSQSEMQEYIKAQPHPNFPDVTVGAYHAAYDAAMLHATVKSSHTPIPYIVSLFAKTGMTHKEIGQYYDQVSAKTEASKMGTTPTPAPTKEPKQ